MNLSRITSLTMCTWLLLSGNVARADEHASKSKQSISMLSNQIAAEQLELPAWSLPINEGLQVHSSPSIKLPKSKLKGEICSDETQDPIAHRLDDLLDVALKRAPETQKLNQSVAHYRNSGRKMLATTMAAVDYLIPYTGFSMSSEAGDIILDEKLKVKSLASAEFARQKHVDQMHMQLVSSLMQIAMGLGQVDQRRAESLVCEGTEQLQNLIGPEETEKTVAAIKAWSQNINVPETVFAQDIWTVKQQQSKLKTVLDDALDSDPIVKGVTKSLHKFNHQSKFKLATGRVVETTLGVAALTPSLIGPAAQLGLVAFMTATGGPEESKLLKELYLDKRLESRAQILSQKANLALSNYQTAILTRNPVLLAFSEMLVADMSGPQSVGKVFSCSVLSASSSLNVSTSLTPEETTAFMHMEHPSSVLLLD